jgi:hypothetical protein
LWRVGDLVKIVNMSSSKDENIVGDGTNGETITGGDGEEDSSRGDGDGENVFGYHVEAQLKHLYEIFGQREIKDLARPVSIYKFAHKTRARWLYTSGGHPLTRLPFQSEVVEWGDRGKRGTKRKGERETAAAAAGTTSNNNGKGGKKRKHNTNEEEASSSHSSKEEARGVPALPLRTGRTSTVESKSPACKE